MHRSESTIDRRELMALQEKCAALQKEKEELQRKAALYRFLAEKSTDIIWQLNDCFQFTYVSPAVHNIFGYRVEEIIGRSLFDVLTLQSGEDVRKSFAKRIALRDKRQTWEDSVYTVEAIRKNGACLWAEVSVSPIFDTDNQLKGYTGIMRDISERRRQEETICRYAFYDPLTGLPNRRLFDAVMERAVSRKTQFDDSFAVLFFDVDGLKKVNDVYGHTAGDALLQTIAQRLRGSVRKEDFVARLAGDEFTALLFGCANGSSVSFIVDRVIANCHLPIAIQGNQVCVGISVGISFCPTDAINVVDLLSYADQAMYKAKKSGGGRYFCYGQ